METSQPGAAPRPKGFVRRNWIALALLASTLPMSCLEVHLMRSSKFSTVQFHLSDGVFAFAYWSDPLSVSHASFGFSAPSWGLATVPHYFSSFFKRSKQVQGYATPLWAPILCLVMWIAFREWRRKRRKA
jgi:hypothetical protein